METKKEAYTRVAIYMFQILHEHYIGLTPMRLDDLLSAITHWKSATALYEDGNYADWFADEIELQRADLIKWGLLS